MSRSGYSDDGDCDDTWAWIRYSGAIKSAIRGARGQAFLREIITTLDAMPEKVLIDGELQSDGKFCALGAVGRARGIDMASVDTEDWSKLSSIFGIAESLARQIMYENDDGVDTWQWHYSQNGSSHRQELDNLGELRWQHVRTWAERNLIGEKA